MLKLIPVLRFLAVCALSLWAQNAAAGSFACGSFFSTANNPVYVDTTNNTCHHNKGALQNGYKIDLSVAPGIGTVTVSYYRGGGLFRPAIQSLSCSVPGTRRGSSAIQFILPNDGSSVGMNCTLHFKFSSNGQTVDHSFNLSMSYGPPASTFPGPSAALLNSTVNVTSPPVPPTVTLSGLAGIIGPGPHPVTAQFSTSVTGFTAGDLNLINATVSNFRTVGPTGTANYAFDITPSASGTISVQVPAGSATNLAATPNTASNTLSAIADLTPPTATLSGLSGTVGAGGQTVTASFGEAVTGFTLSDLTLTNATASSLTIQITPGDYTFQVTPVASGAITVKISAGSVADSVGNVNSVSNTLTATADFTPPQPVLSGLTGTVYAGAVSPVTVTFLEDVTGFTLADVTVSGATVSNFLAASALSYSFDVTPTGAGPVSVSIDAGLMADLAGNLNTAATPLTATAVAPTPIAASFTFSPSAGPSPLIVGFTDSSTPTSGQTLTSWAWSFGDGFTSSLQNPVHYYPTQGVYTVTLQACDAIGCSTATGTVTVADSLLSLTPVLSGLTSPIGAPQTVTVTFPNDLDDTALGGLTLSDFSSTNLTLSALTLVSRGPLATDPQTFTLTATPIGSGPVSISLPAGRVKNRAGVSNSVSNTLNATADLTAPSVGITGLPAEITGPTSFAATITFSKAVTGFSAADITISGGAVTALSGSGAVYTASVSATGAADLTMSVAANVAQDAAGNGNVASATVSSLNVTAARTTATVAHFMQTRANALLSNQPALTDFLRGGAGGQFAAEVTRGGGSVVFDSGFGGPIWARLNANWSTDLGAPSQYVFGALGGHSRLSDTFLLGGMLQFDHLREVNGAAVSEGNGWLLGPYFVAKLPHQPLYFEGSLLYGQSANTVSPLGTYTDAFSTERWLATLGITGEITRGKLTLLPYLDAKYTSDSQAAYVDGFGNLIAAQTIGLAQVSAGLDVEVALNAVTTLKAGASGTWSYSSGSALAPGYQGGRARLSFGLAHRFARCGGLELSGFYDGIGAADFESYGAEFTWETCF